MKLSTVLFFALPFLFALSGCSIPFIGGDEDCEYRSVFSVARVIRVQDNLVTFEVSGHRPVEKPRNALPPEYRYEVGNDFNVQQRILTDGDNCEPYILEIISPM